MTDNSAFDSKKIGQTARDQHGILEELNIPPKIIAFLRENAKKLQIGAICVVLAILASSAYDYYRENQRDSASALLAKATQEASEEQRTILIKDLLDQYPRTDAAIWGRMELGHIAFQNGNFENAISIYTEVLDEISSDNPLAPLVRYGLAQAYESNNDSANAIKYYKSLTELTGFVAEGYHALGRIYESQGQPEKAKEAYQQALEQENIAPGVREMLEGKLATLKQE